MERKAQTVRTASKKQPAQDKKHNLCDGATSSADKKQKSSAKRATKSGKGEGSINKRKPEADFRTIQGMDQEEKCSDLMSTKHKTGLTIMNAWDRNSFSAGVMPSPLYLAKPTVIAHLGTLALRTLAISPPDSPPKCTQAERTLKDATWSSNMNFSPT